MKILITILSLFFIVNVQAQSLKENAEQVIKSKNATVGVAVKREGSDNMLIINGEKHYPMQSVYKFHLALYILDQVDKGMLSLEQKIAVNKSELRPCTWNPLAKDYPEGDVNRPLGEILKYAVSYSDNNACDVLFRWQEDAVMLMNTYTALESKR